MSNSPDFRKGKCCVICGDTEDLVDNEPLRGSQDYPEDSLGAWWKEWLHLKPGEVAYVCQECVQK